MEKHQLWMEFFSRRPINDLVKTVGKWYNKLIYCTHMNSIVRMCEGEDYGKAKGGRKNQSGFHSVQMP